VREIRTLRANGRGLETEMTDGSSGTLTRKGRNSQGSQDLSIHRASSRPYRSASLPASRRRPRGSSTGGYARRSRCRGRAPATRPRLSLRTPTRRRASSRSASSSSRGATSASPQLSPLRAAPRPRETGSAARTRPTSAAMETEAAESSSKGATRIAPASSRDASRRCASACEGDTPRGHRQGWTSAPSLTSAARRSGTNVRVLRGRQRAP
jgi:hypothetical protein